MLRCRGILARAVAQALIAALVLGLLPAPAQAARTTPPTAEVPLPSLKEKAVHGEACADVFWLVFQREPHSDSIDGDGVRVKTTTTPAGGTANVVNYLVDTSRSLSHVVVETNAAGDATAYYVRSDDELVGIIRPDGAGGWTRKAVHADGIGSIRKLTDAAGAVTDSYDYTAFGELLAHVGSDPQPYAFAGEPLDPNSGFQYHRARWMDPRIGRFHGMDPWRGSSYDPVTLHRYTYASGNPVNSSDPTGEWTLGESSLATGIISSLTSGLVNVVLSAAIHGVAGEELSASDLHSAFWVGAITAPVGGALTRALAPALKAFFEPFLIAVGSMRRVTLVGSTTAWERFLIRASRMFVNTNVKYPGVSSTPVGMFLKKYVRFVDWENHHVAIQQCWSRVGSKQQLYSDLLANEGLRRIGNGLWNLLPLPASMNNWLGKSPVATQMLATIYYGVMVFGPAHVIEHMAEAEGEGDE